MNINMKKNLLLTIGAAMMLTISLNSCSSDGDGDEVVNMNTSFSSMDGEPTDDPDFNPNDLNVLHIQSESGNTETCELQVPNCGNGGWQQITNEDGSTRNVYRMIFSSVIQNSSLFNVMTLMIETDKDMAVSDLKVGDTFDCSAIRFHAMDDRPVDGIISCYGTPDYALDGHVIVANKRLSDDGKAYVMLILQDLKFYSSDQNCTYTFNAVVDFEINDYRPVVEEEVNLEELLVPTDPFIIFMTDAISKECQGQHTFFSDGPEEQECLIINSEQEFQQAYKGDWNGSSYVNFRHCTLVIGRTYGENGSVSLGDYELIDNGDTYQLNMTLNNNVNPLHTYSPNRVNLYFWKILPKMENKPVVFNRIKQDVNIETLADDFAHKQLQHRWLLQCYIDSEGKLHTVSNAWGDEHYTIEFKEDGKVEGLINDNAFSCSYTLPYTSVFEGELDNWNGEYVYGAINLKDLNVTVPDDDDPLTEVFMRAFSANQFKIWSGDGTVLNMVLRVSEKEVFGFFPENLQRFYGYEARPYRPF